MTTVSSLGAGTLLGDLSTGMCKYVNQEGKQNPLVHCPELVVPGSKAGMVVLKHDSCAQVISTLQKPEHKDSFARWLSDCSIVCWSMRVQQMEDLAKWGMRCRSTVGMYSMFFAIDDGKVYYADSQAVLTAVASLSQPPPVAQFVISLPALVANPQLFESKPTPTAEAYMLVVKQRLYVVCGSAVTHDAADCTTVKLPPPGALVEPSALSMVTSDTFYHRVAAGDFEMGPEFPGLTSLDFKAEIGMFDAGHSVTVKTQFLMRALEYVGAEGRRVTVVCQADAPLMVINWETGARACIAPFVRE